MRGSLDPMDDRKLLLDRLREHSSRGPTELLRDHRDWLGPCKLPEPIEVVVAPRLLPARHVSWSRYTSPAPDSDCNRPPHEMQPSPDVPSTARGVPSLLRVLAQTALVTVAHRCANDRLGVSLQALHDPQFLALPIGLNPRAKNSTDRICEDAKLGRKASRDCSVMFAFQIARKFVQIDHHVRCSGATKRHHAHASLRGKILAQ